MTSPTEEGPVLVTLEGVGLSLSGNGILKGLDLTIQRREILTVVGPNGAGKTSLARLVLGLVKPTSGRITKRKNLKIGYVPQRFSIDPVIPITVARFLALPRPAPAETLRACLSEVGIERLVDRPIQSLSGGEFQRVLLARALLREPDLLVLDEPVQQVDFSGQVELYERIADLRDRHGCGILLISHDLHLVMARTDRVICLNHHICCSGAPEAVSQHPEYLSLFGKRAASVMAFYSHEHDHRHGLAGEVLPKDTRSHQKADHGNSERKQA